MGTTLSYAEKAHIAETDINKQPQRKLLLIENDHYLSQVFLVKDHHPEYQAKKIAMGLKINQELKNYLSDNRPDMMVLDIGYVDISELNIIRELRTIYDGPLVVLTSKSSEEEHFKSLDLGADDYLLKPIDSRILFKRIETLFRHQNEKSTNVELASMKMGDVCLQPQSQKCFINGECVKLTTFEFNLLKSLVEHQGNILSRDELYNTLLRRDYNGVERTLDVRMSQLREKLTVAGMKDNQIETVWGQGYMLNHINA